ncbi:hypothetical protein SELMODRAFT_229530 [Selaginella moellendorffii]|uniref:Uncharacterized protein n=1 Tax=Selaginella moellendorffii TaxID=88036 RepID=D8T403_SELML|nr:homogentisate solanesyltransferase, chloroplastic [Selaginella moellendorffii]EFJ08575.1 hypothetical protein SELMODRAFT_229530 [Selaginella moellendorffii]|eukprot:XP_024519867.1 homogentisate solanesyltransferase, chloroplastic [Selaginella moellendorffii]
MQVGFRVGVECLIRNPQLGAQIFPRQGLKERRTRVICSVSSGTGSDFAEYKSNEEEEASVRQRLENFRDAFWRFLRPHTVRGTIIGSTSLVARALLENADCINWFLVPKALRGLLALICGNGYIVGINQIYDVGIDKVNKPFLPIAAGDLSVSTAWTLVLSLAVLGTGIVATNFGRLITSLYVLGLVLGAMYSVPPLRLKRFAVPAFLIIATVRGFLLNFGVYYATRASLGLPFVWSPHVIFITAFVTLFATVIAITKDLPDVEGDLKFKISTFATKLGVRNISLLGAGLLLTNYIGAVVAAFRFPQVFNTGPMAITHGILGVCLLYQLWLLESAKYSKEAISTFYRFIWNLFYAEYLVFPAI